MSDRRDYILQHFREPVHRPTLVADQDDLLPFDEPDVRTYAGYWPAGGFILKLPTYATLGGISV